MADWTGRALLDIDPELGRDLTAAERAAALEVAVPVVALPRGRCRVADLVRHDAVRGNVLGLLITDGIMSLELALLGRPCARLFGAGDYLLTGDAVSDPIPTQWRLTAETPTDLAVLDDRVLAAGARWPRLAGRLFRAAANQHQRAVLFHGVAQLPRVEDRLLTLLWLLSERWGRVRPDGILLDTPLTHDTLGRMVGAQRPTVSLGLRRLVEHGAVRRVPDGWLLSRDGLRALRGRS